MKSSRITIISLLFFLGMVACEKPLEEQIFSQLAPSTLFTSEDGISSVLNSAYAYAHLNDAQASWSVFYLGGSPTGEVWGAGGSIEALWVQLQDFTWNANHGQMQAQWVSFFNAIRDANIVLDNIDNPDFGSSFVTLTKAEVHFIRGWSYSQLYKLFGPMPMYTSSSDDPLQARASDAETRAFIESELNAALQDLPLDAEFGKATKGATMAVLCMYYLNTKQWQKAADMAQSIMSTNKYALQSNYSDVFAINNEANSEMVWALTKSPTSSVNAVQALTYPPTYPRPFTNNGVFAARTYLYDAFVSTFDSTDTRKDLIVTHWQDAAGKDQAAFGKNQSFPGKWAWDPNSVGWQSGNDIPVFRYADVLLSRAEALNEISGPSQEAIDLINQVRIRAHVAPLNLADYDKSSLRNAILQERSWEFYFEGKSRETLIRHDLLIPFAVARGKNAKPFHVLYPIPQVELDANELLTQNEGY